MAENNSHLLSHSSRGFAQVLRAEIKVLVGLGCPLETPGHLTLNEVVGRIEFLAAGCHALYS